LLVVELTLKK